MSDYAEYADDVLLAVFDRSASNPQVPCRLRNVVSALDPSHGNDWLAIIVHEFSEKGFWTVEIGDGPLVHLTADGLRQAQQIKAQRAKRTFTGYLKSMPRSDWISFIALTISAIALIKK